MKSKLIMLIFSVYLIKFTLNEYRALIKIDHTGGALTSGYATALIFFHHRVIIFLEYLVNKLSVFTWFVLLVHKGTRLQTCTC